MRSTICLVALLGLSLPQAGCFLYSSDDDCNYGGGGGIADYSLRNPYSGLCEWFSGTVEGDNCGSYADMEPVARPDWGECYGYCDGLDETSCLATSGCRAAYVYQCSEGEACAALQYFGCWTTAPSGPIQGGGCAELDAYACSQHDDCVARHWGAGNATDPDDPAGAPCADADCEERPEPPSIGNFESCADEPGDQPDGCYDTSECPAGYVCNAEEICLPPPDPNGDPGYGEDQPMPCYGYCVPEEDPVGPGNCYEEVTCYCDPAIGEYCAPPDCPDGTLPGVKDGCWSGYCIPIAECPDSAPACSAVTDELSCIARPDCSPLYEGVNCTCDEVGNCTCEDWLFEECVAG